MNTIAMRCSFGLFGMHSTAPAHHFRYWSSLTFPSQSTFLPPSGSAFPEPAVDRSEKLACLIPPALIAPEPRHAHCGAEFPGFGLLLARYSKGVLEICLARGDTVDGADEGAFPAAYHSKSNAWLSHVARSCRFIP